jgi:hypothetical protein
MNSGLEWEENYSTICDDDDVISVREHGKGTIRKAICIWT